MATYLKSKNLYQARARQGDRRIVAYGATESEAEENLLLKLGPKPQKGQTLLSYSVQTYLATVENHSHKWRQQIAWALDLHILPQLGNLPIEDLNRANLQAFLNQKQKKLSRTSVSHIRKVLNAILNLAEADELIPRNPIKHVKLQPERTRDRPEPYNAAECRRCIAMAAGTALEAPLSLAIYFGLRMGEIEGLEWRDIGQGNIRVRRQGGGSLKTVSSRRDIPTPGIAKELLERLPIANTKRDGKVVTLNRSNIVGHLGTNTTKPRGFKHLCRKAGLREVTFHSLRKSFATGMLEVGCPEILLAQLLGHARSNVTAVYVGDPVETKRAYLAKWIERVSTSNGHTNGHTDLEENGTI